MKGRLRVLIAEDSATDYELLLLELEKSGYDCATTRVDTRDAMNAALDAETWDLVLTDWSMPSFSALEALELLRRREIDVPVIIASGSVDEETAVIAMRAGANDFIAKHKLARLAPAIDRELREAKVRHERNRMHEQLLVSDRMASVGLLAAGVAHEINNPLAAVMANLEIAAHRLRSIKPGAPPPLDLLAEELGDAMKAAERIRDIVRDIRMFSRSDGGATTLVDVRDVVRSSLRMARNEIRHRAALVEEYGEVRAVSADESRLGQVFLNLIVNAAQAIPIGNADANEIRVSTGLDGERVFVEIADSGAGMPPEVVRQLFTPFFTTKPRGLGTGLGLSICHRIVSELGGEIDVRSAPGKGTTFRVSLPAAAARVEPEPAPPPARAAAGQGGRVLVVDDDAAVGRSVARSLGEHHRVEVLSVPREALARITAGERYDAILCDVMMPEMTGIELFTAIRALDPAQAERVIFLTGGTFTEDAHAFLERTGNPTVEKPFDRATLLALVDACVAPTASR